MLELNLIFACFMVVILSLVIVSQMEAIIAVNLSFLQQVSYPEQVPTYHTRIANNVAIFLPR